MYSASKSRPINPMLLLSIVFIVLSRVVDASNTVYINGQSYRSCDIAAGECAAGTDYGAASTSACWCGTPHNSAGDIIGPDVVTECIPCTVVGEENRRCGCFVGVSFTNTLSTICSMGICVKKECSPDTYMSITDIQHNGQLNVGNSRDSGMIFPTLAWSSGCMECQTCPTNQKRTAPCNGITANPTCSPCAEANTCDGRDQIPCKHPNYYCIDGIEHSCDPWKAQSCLRNTPVAVYDVGCPAGAYYSPDKCTPCPTATYLFSDTPFHTITACTLCPPGTFQKTASLQATSIEVCDKCQAGMYASQAGNTEGCTVCEDGTFQKATGGSICSECQPGQYWTSAKADCKLCSSGSYAPTKRMLSCVLCEKGTYNVQMGRTTCTQCAADMSTCVLTNVDTQSLDCSPGKTESQSCDYCPPGFVVCNPYAADPCDVNNLHDCMVCPANHYCPGQNRRLPWTLSEPGRNWIKTKGTHKTDNVLETCSLCLPDQYMFKPCNLANGNTQCIDCSTPVAMKTYVTQACTATTPTALLDCLSTDQLAGSVCNPCLPGTQWLLGECQACQPNTFRRQSGACIPCPADTLSGPGASQCTRICPSGMIAPDGNICVNQMTGAERTVGWASMLPSVNGGAVWLEEVGGVVVVNNRGSNTGLLWLLDVDIIRQRESLVAGGGGIPGKDGMGSVAGLGQIVALAHAAAGGYILAETGGRICRLTYHDAAMAFNVETIITLSNKQVGGILPLPTSGSIMFTDLNKHGVWMMMGITVIQVRGGGSQSMGFYDTRKGFFSNPRSLAKTQNDDWIMVLDDYGIWKFDMNVAAMDAVDPVCGGGSLASLNHDSQGYNVVGCRSLDFGGVLNAASMVIGDVRGESSVLFTCNVGVAYFAIKDSMVFVLTSTTTTTIAYSQVFWGNDNRLFATQCDTVFSRCKAVELGLDKCLCNAGFYCLSNQCVQAGAGTFALSWSSAPIPCKAGTVSTGPGKGSRTEACVVYELGGDFTTHADGALNWEKTCPANLYYNHETRQCVSGCNMAIGEYMMGQACAQCPQGSHPSTYTTCELCPGGTYGVSPGVCVACSDGAMFSGADRCINPATDCADGGILCTNRTWDMQPDIAISDIEAIGQTVYVATTNSLWVIRSDNPAEVLVSGEFMFGMIEVDDDETTLYSAAKGGSCVYKVNLNGGFSYTVLVGQCHGLPGDKDGAEATFSDIQSLAYMHVDGKAPVLFVGSLAGGNCGSIRAISLFDNTVSTVASFDFLRGNRRMLGQCLNGSSPGLKTMRGMDILYYFHDLLGIIQTRNDGVYAEESIYPQENFPILDMCVKSGTVAFVRKNRDDGILGILSASQGLQTEQLAQEGLTAVECVGHRYWVGNGSSLNLWIRPPGEPPSCVNGYVANIDGVCMQVGVGQYALPNGTGAANCKGGTFGLRAGAWSHVFCQDCPPGSISQEGAFKCEPCPADRPLSSKGSTECVAHCPAGTYHNTLAKCVSCPAGWSSKDGSMASSDCFACAPNTYSNDALTQGLCLPCLAGYQSNAGSHHCVITCGNGECSMDGEKCSPPMQNWKMLTSIQTVGSSMRAVTVGPNGCVFYSDGNSLSYFKDDCPSSGTVLDTLVCNKTGIDLLAVGGGYRGIQSLAIDPSYVGLSQRYMYIGSITTHRIYRITITFSGGEVDVQATQRHLAANDPWTSSPSSWTIGRGEQGFADGSFETAMFDMPSEIEITLDGTKLYVSDFGNHRIRLVDLKLSTVTTLLGNGKPCWRTGPLSYCPSSDVPTDKAQLPVELCNQPVGSMVCASAKNPLGIGLSVSNNALYLPMFQDDAVGVVQLNDNDNVSSLSRMCSYNQFLDKFSYETCKPNAPNSRSCFVRKPFDIVATGQSLFVAVTNGITQIDLVTLDCKQVSGTLWDWNPATSWGNADGELDPLTGTCTSKVFNPFRMVSAPDKGMMYLADFSNGAVKRVFIGGQCTCPEGTVFMPGARSCYNPAEKWSQKMLVQCNQPGFFALEGDTKCRSCIDAAAAGIYVANCAIWAQRMKPNTMGYPFSKIISTASSSSMRGDWYGISTAPVNRQWNDIFNDNSMLYSQNTAGGHAPNANNKPVALKYIGPLSKKWMVERDPALQPRLMLPGLWYPCASKIDSATKTCECSTVEAVFGKSGWQNLRESAMQFKGQVLVSQQPLTDYTKGTPLSSSSLIQGWSRFMLMGKAPTFDLMTHFQETVQLKPLQYAGFQPLTMSNNYGGGEKCFVGWPAHYACPSGFVWVLEPKPFETADILESVLTDTIACLSCLPGTFSSSSADEGGGPYQCQQCDWGEYSADVAATRCGPCPNGTYAEGMANQECQKCDPNHYTNPGAQSRSQCNPCPPGSGKCDSCIPGQFQSLAAQDGCESCPPGSISDSFNAVACTLCPLNQFQARTGMMRCETCPQGTYSAQKEGATACSVCDNKQCKLTVGGVCGQGCGLNQFWDYEATPVPKCVLCSAGTLNTDEPCATSRVSCWTPRTGQFFSSATQQVLKCPEGQGPTDTLDGCEPCAAGTIYVLDRGCVPCAGGHFSSSIGQTQCSDCPAGTYTSESPFYDDHTTVLFTTTTIVPKGNTGCLACEKGHFGGVVGISACLPCRAGTYASMMGLSECTKCAIGTMSLAVASPGAVCGTCPANTYSGEGATGCTECVGGIVNTTSSQCVGCGLGMYEFPLSDTDRTCIGCGRGLVNLWKTFANSSSDCVRCPIPIAYAGPGGDHCINSTAGNVPNAMRDGSIACAKGTYRGPNDTTTSVCLTCAAGTFMKDMGGTACVACDTGKYAYLNGSTICHTCGPDTVATERGLSTCRSCDPGYMASGDKRACVQCSNNTVSVAGEPCQICIEPPYAPAGASQCLPCPDWTTFIGDACQTCPAGSYMVHDTDSGYSCISCGGNTINPHSGATSRTECKACGWGYVPNIPERSQCVQCPEGKQPNLNDNVTCVLCNPGTFSLHSMAQCAQCSTGQFSSGMGATQCFNCSAGQYSNTTGAVACAPCGPGTYSNGSSSRRCVMCDKSMFTNQSRSTACQNRTVQCSVGEYVMQYTDRPDKDNECMTCDPCGLSDIMVTKNQQYWDNNNNDAVMNPATNALLCPGTGLFPQYQCVSNIPEAGWQLVGVMAGASADDGSGGGFSVDRVPCPDIAAAGSMMGEYVAGQVPGCFVGCKYGIKPGGTVSYYSAHPHTSDSKDMPWSNVFNPVMMEMIDRVCLTCPTTQCPWGTYRPKVTDTCGPSCGTTAVCGLMQQDNGCTGQCREPVNGTVMISGSSVLGQDLCDWACDRWWFISDTSTKACSPCASVNPDTFCSEGYVLVDTTTLCFPTSKSADLCKKCDNITGGRPRAWNNLTQACTYECKGGYFALDAQNKSCAQCSIHNAEECPVGTFRDVEGCLTKGTYPACLPCQSDFVDTILFSFTTNGGNSSRNCSALCQAGYHSRTRDTNALVWDMSETAIGVNVFNLNCERCYPQVDSITCHGACQGGQFRNRSVANGLTVGACVHCKLSQECPMGTYAETCSGNESANRGCIDCSTSLLYDADGSTRIRQFVNYDLIKDLEKNHLIQWVQGGHCPTVCLPNYVLMPKAGGGGGDECVSCRSWVHSKGCQMNSVVAAGQPQPCEFMFSHWNATPGVVWWDISPSFIYAKYGLVHDNKLVSRAGQCWACPYGEGTVLGDTDLCMLRPGMGRQVDENWKMTQVSIPRLGKDLYLSMREPVMAYVNVMPTQNRRMLTILPSEKNILLQAASSSHELVASSHRRLMSGDAPSNNNMACKVGYYKPNSGNGPCYGCPHGMSTESTGSISVEQCLCLPGWSRLNVGCLPCPPETFVPYGGSTCLSCPTNETTFGRSSNSKCACKWGQMRGTTTNYSTTCVPCPPDSYCRPCMTSDLVCPSNRVILSSCFPNSTSMPGSTHIENCTCASGLAALARPGILGAYYCSSVPPTAVYDPILRRIGCKAGWKAQWSPDGKVLQACTLCDHLGMMYDNALATCVLCPKGTFADTQDAIGGCTACPKLLTTTKVGATSLADCGCPPPMAMVGQECKGCRADQYSENGECKSCPLYSMSRAGGTSLTDCQCQRGYWMQPSGVCEACEKGTYSGHVGGGPCLKCPPGSSTVGIGSDRIRQCNVCAAGYALMDNVGCILNSLKSASYS